MDVSCPSCKPKCGPCDRPIDAGESFVAVGPSVSARFDAASQASQYIRPETQTVSKLRTAGSAFSLLVSTGNIVEGVRIERDGLYDISATASFQAFDDATSEVLVPGPTAQDLRVFIDDVKFQFPYSPYGQGARDAGILITPTQNQTLAFSSQIYLKRNQTVTVRALYENADDGVQLQLNLAWALHRIERNENNRLRRITVQLPTTP